MSLICGAQVLASVCVGWCTCERERESERDYLGGYIAILRKTHSQMTQREEKERVTF